MATLRASVGLGEPIHRPGKGMAPARRLRGGSEQFQIGQQSVGGNRDRGK